MVQRQRLAGKAQRFKLRGNRLVDAEPGLLGLVAGSGSNWSEGWGVCWGCLRLGPRAGDGRFICVRCGALQLICYVGWIDPIKVPVKQEVHE